MTKNQNVLKWVEEMKALTQPDKVVWIDGSEEQLKALRDEAIATGEMIELNQEKLPGCLYHRTAENDVARVEDRTFICSREKENAGPTNNWMDPKEMYAKLTKLYDGVMKGRTMYVIPYSMGPIGSPIAKVGVELTDSIYVVLNMDIMTRMGAQAFKNLPDDSNDFVRCLHSKADVDPEKRYIVSSPKTTRSGLSTQLTAVTYCSARSALHSVSLLTRAGRKAGWLNICLSSALRSPMATSSISQQHSPQLAVKQTSLCLFLPRDTRRQAMKYSQ